MTARRVTRAKVDTVANLYANYKAAEAAYTEQVERIKRLGAGAYSGSQADLIISQHERATTDWPRLAKRFKIPERAVKAATKRTAYLRADVAWKP